MATKIRLQRHGRKKKPFFWIVVADSRAKRDGKFIEKLGTYNPIENPAEIVLNMDSAVKWLHNGAQPTETARKLLSYKGVLLKHHLEIGLRKGAITQEQVDTKLGEWLTEKETKVNNKIDKLAKEKETSKAKKIQSEKEYRETKFSSVEEIPSDIIKKSEVQVEEAAEVKKEAPEAKKETTETKKEASKDK